MWNFPARVWCQAKTLIIEVACGAGVECMCGSLACPLVSDPVMIWFVYLIVACFSPPPLIISLHSGSVIFGEARILL